MIPRFDTSELDAISEWLQHIINRSPVITPSGIVTLDNHCVCAKDGTPLAQTQNDWISYWNKITDGRIFPSAANYYRAFKQLKAAEERGTPKEKAQAHDLAESLRTDFKESWIITSTRILYQSPSLETEIIQHYGNKNPVLQTKKELDVPEWFGVSVMEALQDRKCLPYLQMLFGTIDDAVTIVSTLRYISGVDAIKLWTPPFKHDNWATRKGYPERAVRFHLDSDYFQVNGNVRVGNYLGRSRGVRLLVPLIFL